MSWGFGGLSAAIPSGSSAQGNAAPDLESIETEVGRIIDTRPMTDNLASNSLFKR